MSGTRRIGAASNAARDTHVINFQVYTHYLDINTVESQASGFRWKARQIGAL